jgi:uncharacterized membrane protein
MTGEQTDARWTWPKLLLAWGVTRGVLVFLGSVKVTWYPGGYSVQSDLILYTEWLPTIQAGFLPADELWQYPPGAALFFLVGSLGSDPQLTLLLAILATDLVLTLVLARHYLLSGWFWIVAGVLIGPVLVFRFDVVPALFAVLAVLAAGRPVRVGLWSALGAVTKLWPVLVLVILPRRDFLRGAGAFLGVTAVIMIMAAAIFDNLTGFVAGQRDRGLQIESLAALPFMVAKAAGMQIDVVYRYGALEIGHSAAGPAVLLLSLGLLLVMSWLAICWWRGVLAAHVPADVAFTVVLASVVFSRVLSPQFSVWLLALGAICLASARTRMWLPIALISAAALVGQVLYPIGYLDYSEGHWVAVAVQVIRISLTVIAAVVALMRISRRPQVPVVRLTGSHSTSVTTVNSAS